ncbi:MAG: hypothetical protein QG605_2301, partial [Euryarchaeota archaeon]|nr:hypothetical protein [Euryarchaeota archaeon]
EEREICRSCEIASETCEINGEGED